MGVVAVSGSRGYLDGGYESMGPVRSRISTPGNVTIPTGLIFAIRACFESKEDGGEKGMFIYPPHIANSGLDGTEVQSAFLSYFPVFYT